MRLTRSILTAMILAQTLLIAPRAEAEDAEATPFITEAYYRIAAADLARGLPGLGSAVCRRWKSMLKWGSSTQTGVFSNGIHLSRCR